MDLLLTARHFLYQIFSVQPSLEQVDPAHFPFEHQPSSLPQCLSRRRLVELRFLVARQLRVRFLLPASTLQQVALAAPPVAEPDRQVD